MHKFSFVIIPTKRHTRCVPQITRFGNINHVKNIPCQINIVEEHKCKDYTKSKNKII
ncbi:hypothetical protein Hanom_Chr01g00074441 [Helianthus anomalus]